MRSITVLAFAAALCAVASAANSTTVNPTWASATQSTDTATSTDQLATVAGNGFIGASVLNSKFEPTGAGLDLTTGAKQWFVDVPVNASAARWVLCPNSASPAFLIMPSVNNKSGEVIAVDTTTGKSQWTLPLLINAIDAVSVTCAMGGAVTVVLGPSTLNAVNTTSGALKWTQYVNATSIVGFELWSKDNKKSFFLFQDNAGLHSVDVELGVAKLILPIAFVPDGDLQSPFATTRHLFLMNGGFNVTAFDAMGTVVWQLPVLGQASFGDVLFIKTSTVDLGAVNISTGKQLFYWANLTLVVPTDILNIGAGTVDGAVTVMCSPVNSFGNIGFCVGITTMGTVAWRQNNITFNGFIQNQVVSSNTYYGVNQLSFTGALTPLWTLNMKTGAVRNLGACGTVLSLSETATSLIVQNGTHTLSFPKW